MYPGVADANNITTNPVVPAEITAYLTPVQIIVAVPILRRRMRMNMAANQAPNASGGTQYIINCSIEPAVMTIGINGRRKLNIQ
jgi:hypothetical protein